MEAQGASWGRAVLWGIPYLPSFSICWELYLQSQEENPDGLSSRLEPLLMAPGQSPGRAQAPCVLIPLLPERTQHAAHAAGNTFLSPPSLVLK